MPVAVRAEGVGKSYRLGVSPPGSLRELANRAVRKVFKRRAAGDERRPTRGTDGEELFWALRDASFEVAQGRSFGVIGRNGAGKSTLLKILSRITPPSAGRVSLWGRVASLLEVGTGFHPELTGRENVFLNGALLGMTRAEIRRRFDEIVAFAEVETFIDVPVKRYSSGMYVRLAFAVAAHLDPEILIVDEVLAVGDVAFQEKCLGKMTAVSSEGRTVLFVSHNMTAIRQLCQRALWLEGGRTMANGPANEVTSQYLEAFSNASSLAAVNTEIERLPSDPAFRLLRVSVSQQGAERTHVWNGAPIEVAAEYEVARDTAGLYVAVEVRDLDGVLLFESLHNGTTTTAPVAPRGRWRSTLTIPADFLAPMRYELRIIAAIAWVRYCLPQPITFVIDVSGGGLVNRAYPGHRSGARLAPLIDWRLDRLQE